MLTLLLSAEEGGLRDAAGNETLFADFYEQYMPKVFGYISYRVNDRQTAEDLTSAVFEKALAAFATYDSRKAGMSTWVFTIARNTLTDHFRAAHTRKTVVLDETMDFTAENCDPEEELLKADEIRKLRKLIEGLSQNERSIISLKFGGGLTNRDIARTLGLSESNVGVIVYRTVRKLRDGFGEAEDG